MSLRNRHIDKLNSNKSRSGNSPTLTSSSPSNSTIRPKTKKEAAVLIPICTIQEKTCILFTKRSAHLPTHASQISFPGGFLNPNETHEMAALREMQEECPGWYPYDQTESIQIIGKTQPIPSLNGTMVTPVVAVLNYDLGSVSNITHLFGTNGKEINSENINENHEGGGGEVDFVFVRSIQELVTSESTEKLSWMQGQTNLSALAPMYPGTEGKIWGLTAFILQPILKHVLIPTFLSQDQSQSKI